MKQILSAVAFFSAMFIASAQAAPMNLGGVMFDSDNAASDVLWAQGGVFAGLEANRREACVDPTNPNSTVGATGVNCRADEAAGFNLDEFVELTGTNPFLNPEDVIAVFFDNPLINGPGDDLLIFEQANQSDEPTVALMLNGVAITGTVLATLEIDGKMYTISGFDFSDAPLSLAAGMAIGQPIFIETLDSDGSADISAIVGLNFTVIPLPAAWPLFFAGLAGLGFATGRKRRKL